MDIIEITRSLGEAIQRDERFIRLRTAEQNSDNDQELQKLIGEFNLKRMALDNESHKEECDSEKLKTLSNEMRKAYADVMANPNMMEYSEAKQSMDELLRRVNAIISKSVEGEDPQTADYVPTSCDGGCSSCSGCH